MLIEERVEYDILFIELKGSDEETDWSAMLQTAGWGWTIRDAIA